MKVSYRIFTAFFFICIVAITISCTSRQNAVSRLESLYEELQQNCDEYSADDWDAAIAEMNDIDDMLKQNQSDYSDEEIKEIGRLKGLCLAQIAKYSVHSFKDQLKNVINEAEGMFEGLTEGLTDSRR